MAGIKILILLLPLLCLDGVHLKKGPKAGKPWIPPAHARPLPDDDPDDLTDYVNTLYQSPDAVPYPPVQAMPPPPSNRKLRGFRCPQPNSFFRYTQNCEEYVNCTNYIPLPSACPPGLYFNPELQGSEFPCDHPHNVDCDDSYTPYEPEPITRMATTPPPPPPPPPPQPEEVDFNCPDPYGYFRHKDCDSYVECKNNQPKVVTCPEKHYFNPRSSWKDDPCDERSRAHCRKEPEPITRMAIMPPPPPPPPPPQPEEVDFNCPDPYGYFRHKDCDSYVECKNNQPKVVTCPEKHYFNPRSSWKDDPCDEQSRAHCRKEPEPITRMAIIPPPPPPPPPPQPEEVDFNCPDPYGYFRHKDCDSYVECKNNQPKVVTCPDRHYSNPRSSWKDDPCDERSRAHCKKARRRPALPKPRPERRREYMPRPAPRQRDFTCPQPHGYYRHSDECNSYVECKDSVPMTHSCPPGLHFNPNIPWTQQPCHQPRRAQCIQTEVTIVRTTTTPAPTTVRTTERPAPITPRYKYPRTDYQCQEQNGYFPHTDQCGQYIECKNYVPLRYTCPTGLHFNPRSQWIDYPCAQPSEAQCNPRPKTTTTTTPAPTTPAPTTPAPKYRYPEEEEEYECERPYGYFPHSECDEYIECKNYIPRTYACPAGLHFNPSAQWTQYPCDHPSRVQCNNYK